MHKLPDSCRLPYPAQCPRAGMGGFTLMEVIVAIALLAIVTAISWRGLDGMVRTQSRLQENAESLARTQTSLAQWSTDLNAIATIPNITALDWDGKVFRITRTVGQSAVGQAPAVQVVAWSDRSVGGQRYWSRWHSPSLSNRAQWQSAWQRAQEWGRQSGTSASPGEVVLLPMVQWEIFYNRGGGWINPQSSQQNQIALPNADGSATPSSGVPNATSVPDSIRLRIRIAPSQAVNGWLSTDWLNPVYSGARL